MIMLTTAHLMRIYHFRLLLPSRPFFPGNDDEENPVEIIQPRTGNVPDRSSTGIHGACNEVVHP